MTPTQREQWRARLELFSFTVKDEHTPPQPYAAVRVDSALAILVEAMEEATQQAHEYESRAHAIALEEAKAPCHGLGCGRCSDCVVEARAEGRAEALEEASVEIERAQGVAGKIFGSIDYRPSSADQARLVRALAAKKAGET
jgi:hypothetical protein